MKENETLGEKQDKIIELLEEILRWTRFDGLQKARVVLQDTLMRDSEKIAYCYSDGRGSLEISKMAGISDFAVRSYWKKWASLGLVYPSSKFKGRYERLFSLEELGIEVPTAKGVLSEEKHVENKREVKKEETVPESSEDVRR